MGEAFGDAVSQQFELGRRLDSPFRTQVDPQPSFPEDERRGLGDQLAARCEQLDRDGLVSLDRWRWPLKRQRVVSRWIDGSFRHDVLVDRAIAQRSEDGAYGGVRRRGTPDASTHFVAYRGGRLTVFVVACGENGN